MLLCYRLDQASYIEDGWSTWLHVVGEIAGSYWLLNKTTSSQHVLQSFAFRVHRERIYPPVTTVRRDGTDRLPRALNPLLAGTRKKGASKWKRFQ